MAHALAKFVVILLVGSCLAVAGCDSGSDPYMTVSQACSLVASGQGVPEAAEYAQVPGVHKAYQTGSSHPVFTDEWRALSVDELALVVVYSDTTTDTGIRCGPYSPGDKYYALHKRDITVVVREARTAEIIASKTFEGGRTCPTVVMVSESTTSLKDAPSHDDINAWLRQYIQP